jgi:hypothetical protein
MVFPNLPIETQNFFLFKIFLPVAKFEPLSLGIKEQHVASSANLPQYFA